MKSRRKGTLNPQCLEYQTKRNERRHRVCWIEALGIRITSLHCIYLRRYSLRDGDSKPMVLFQVSLGTGSKLRILHYTKQHLFIDHASQSQTNMITARSMSIQIRRPSELRQFPDSHATLPCPKAWHREPGSGRLTAYLFHRIMASEFGKSSEIIPFMQHFRDTACTWCRTKGQRQAGVWNSHESFAVLHSFLLKAWFRDWNMEEEKDMHELVTGIEIVPQCSCCPHDATSAIWTSISYCAIGWGMRIISLVQPYTLTDEYPGCRCDLWTSIEAVTYRSYYYIGKSVITSA